MTHTKASPRGQTEPDDFVPLDRAAELLGLSRGELWKRLQDDGVELAQAQPGPAGGAPQLGLQRGVLAALGQRWGRATGVSAAAPEVRVGGRVWELVRELEEERDRLEFECRVLAGQIGDQRGQLALSDEGLRLAQQRFAVAEVDLNRELDEHPEREELELRVAAAERQSARLIEELSTARAELGAARASLQTLEREHERSVEHGCMRDAYCDRLEEKLTAALATSGSGKGQAGREPSRESSEPSRESSEPSRESSEPSRESSKPNRKSSQGKGKSRGKPTKPS